jgi:hypothetical protein
MKHPLVPVDLTADAARLSAGVRDGGAARAGPALISDVPESAVPSGAASFFDKITLLDIHKNIAEDEG